MKNLHENGRFQGSNVLQKPRCFVVVCAVHTVSVLCTCAAQRLSECLTWRVFSLVGQLKLGKPQTASKFEVRNQVRVGKINQVFINSRSFINRTYSESYLEFFFPCIEAPNMFVLCISSSRIKHCKPYRYSLSKSHTFVDFYQPPAVFKDTEVDMSYVIQLVFNIYLYRKTTVVDINEKLLIESKK